jgi:hypothetical protein
LCGVWLDCQRRPCHSKLSDGQEEARRSAQSQDGQWQDRGA